MIHSLEIKKAGPLQNKTIDFKAVNLIVGNNEEGKTTLTDILIHELFQVHKKDGLIKPLISRRFELDDQVSLSRDPDSPELGPYASLLVIREGDNRWGGKSGLDVEDTAFWNQEIRAVIYGNDKIYSKIQKDITTLLGVSRANTWLNKFHSNMQDFLSVVEEENRALDMMISAKDSLFHYQEEHAAIQAELDAMTQSRELDLTRRRKALIDQYFDVMARQEDLSRQKQELEAKDLSRKIKSWQDIQSRKQETAHALVRQDSELEYLLRAQNDREEQARELHREVIENQIRLERAREEEASLSREKTELMQGEKARAVTRRSTRSPLWIAGFIFNIMAGFSGLVLGILDSLSVLKIAPELNRILLPLFYGAGGVFIFLFILMLALHLAAMARVLDQGEKDTARLLEELETRIGLAHEKSLMLEQAEAALEKRNLALQSHSDREHAEKVKKEKERLSALQVGIQQEESDWQALNRSYEQLIAEQNTLDGLGQKAAVISREFETMQAEVKKAFSTDNKERLHLESKELDKLLKKTEGAPDYNEEDYQEKVKRKDALSQSIQSINSEWGQLKARILSRISQARLALTQGLNQEKLDLFYQDALSWDLREDPYNITGLSARVKDLLLRLEQDIVYSETIDQALKNMDGRLDGLIAGVLHSSRFQELWKSITLGRYVAVHTQIDKKVNIFVEDSTGKRFPFSSLSTGTRNQFYLVMRMSLAALQMDQPGILILDDAFISFDGARRKAAVQILKQMWGEGWQIVYSSVNEQAMEQVFSEVFGGDLHKITL